MSASIKSYRDLIVWQKAMELVDSCYAATRRFPLDERFGLTSQIRRAAVSIPSNIAEGHGRSGRGDYLRFLSIARGSLRELETLLLVSGRQGFVPSATQAALAKRMDGVGRLLYGLSAGVANSTRAGAPSRSLRV